MLSIIMEWVAIILPYVERFEVRTIANTKICPCSRATNERYEHRHLESQNLRAHMRELKKVRHVDQ